MIFENTTVGTRLTVLKINFQMASIEVSLSATLKKPKKSSTPVLPGSPQPAILTQKALTPIKCNGYTTDNHDKENIGVLNK